MYKYSTKKSSKIKLSNPFVITAVILIVLFSISVSYFMYKNSNSRISNTASDQEYINLDPPSPEIIKETEVNKSEITQDSKTTVESTASANNIKPVIIDSSQYGPIVEVRSFIPGVFESNGTCTIDFTKNSIKVTKTVSTYLDASTTHCQNIEIPSSEFSQPGLWQTTVTYKGSVSGISEVKNMEIQ